MGKKIILICALLLIVLGCSNKNEEVTEQDELKNSKERTEILVSAASSLSTAMDEIKKVYEEEHNDTIVTFNFAGSGKLAQQIKQGAPVDVFISANENWMNVLIKEEYIDESNRLDLIGNRLVLIAEESTPLNYNTFNEMNAEELDQIAIGNPESVPAGEYTEATLKMLGKWEELYDHFVFAKDVRQVLTYVETGNAQIGFVYESDALSSNNVKIITYSDPSNHEQIIYPGAVLNDSENKEKGKSFLKFLQSEVGQTILEQYGFTNK